MYKCIAFDMEHVTQKKAYLCKKKKKIGRDSRQALSALIPAVGADPVSEEDQAALRCPYQCSCGRST